MQTHKALRSSLRLSVIAFVAFTVAASSTVSSMQYAAAMSSANLWAVPVNSRIDDGHLQILRLKFDLDSGNPLEKIRITLDKGTSEEKVLEFNGNGVVLVSDPAFVSVDGSIKLKIENGYYALTKFAGKFKIGIDKTELTIGEHDALAEIITTGETISDDAHFKLRAGSSGEADLTPTLFAAPDNVKQDKKYNAFVKEENQGTGNAGKHTINIYLSDDNTLDGSDLLVGHQDVQKLKAGKDRMVPVQFELADDADLGNAFLIVKVDGDGDVSESDETNNTMAEEINVIEGHDLFAHSAADEHSEHQDKEHGKK